MALLLSACAVGEDPLNVSPDRMRRVTADLTRLYPDQQWGVACQGHGADGPRFRCNFAFEITGDAGADRIVQLADQAHRMEATASAYADKHWDGGAAGSIEPAYATSTGHLASPILECSGVHAAPNQRWDFSLLRTALRDRRDGNTFEDPDGYLRAFDQGQCRLRPWTAADGPGLIYRTNESGF